MGGSISNKEIIESRKTELEEKKLQLEIHELESPWYKKPAFLVPILAALSSIFILWITGFFNTKIETLQTKRDQLSMETARLIEIKNSLTTDSASLDSIKRNLQVEVTKLQDSLSYATKPNVSVNLHKIFLHENMDVGIYVNNTGTGIAYFKDVNFYYKGKMFDGTNDEDSRFFDRVIIELGLYKSNLEWQGKVLSNNIDSAGSLGPGQNYSTLKLTKKAQASDVADFLTAIVGLEIEIIYQSAQGKEYKTRKKFSLEECRFW